MSSTDDYNTNYNAEIFFFLIHNYATFCFVCFCMTGHTKTRTAGFLF